MRNKQTNEEFSYQDKVLLKVLGITPVHTQYDPLDAANQGLPEQVLEEKLIKQAFQNLDNFDSEEISMYNIDNHQGVGVLSGVATLFSNLFTHNKPAKNVLKIMLPSGSQDEREYCKYQTEGVLCDLTDDSHDRSAVAALQFYCPYRSPCASTPLNLPYIHTPGCPNLFQNIFYTFLYPWSQSKPFCHAPSYIFRMQASTIDSRSHCGLHTDFYMHVKAVSMNTTSSFWLFNFCTFLIVLWCVLYWFLMKNDMENWDKTLGWLFTTERNILRFMINFQRKLSGLPPLEDPVFDDSFDTENNNSSSNNSLPTSFRASAQAARQNRRASTAAAFEMNDGSGAEAMVNKRRMSLATRTSESVLGFGFFGLLTKAEKFLLSSRLLLFPFCLHTLPKIKHVFPRSRLRKNSHVHKIAHKSQVH